MIEAGDTGRSGRRGEPKLLSFKEAAEILGTSERHLKALWANRKIGGVKVGKLVRFQEENLTDYIKRNRVPPLD
jgi:excisionase family DNA binding protein